MFNADIAHKIYLLSASSSHYFISHNQETVSEGKSQEVSVN